MLPLFWLTLGSVLRLKGQPHIEFGEHAQLRATCPQDRSAVVDFFAPTTIESLRLSPDQNVTAHLRGVPSTCVDIPMDEPCASHSPDRPPKFYCIYTGPAGSATLGPFAAVRVADYVDPSLPPVAIAVVLHCPTPAVETIQSIVPDAQHTGIASTTLAIAHGSRTPGVMKRNLTFEGDDGGDVISFAGLPMPPSAPPPPPPPLPSVPPFTHNPIEVFQKTSLQQFTISTTRQFRIKAWGAAGASSFAHNYRGGSGAYVVAECTLPLGTEVTIVVGAGGVAASHAANTKRAFGGGGMSGCCSYGTPGGGGGGLSGVFIGNPWTQDNALVVAGAGGGAGGAHGGNGGGGGYARGQDSTNGYSGDGGNCYGRGASQSAGGVGGYNGRQQAGSGGGALVGGDGGRSSGKASGGGGAGWYGGGAAAGYYCGGGGGSSYVNTDKCKHISHVDGQVGSGVASSSSTPSDHQSSSDLDYVSGVAVTGARQAPGGPGLVVIASM